MCYALPGPRCSTHMREKMNEKEQALQEATRFKEEKRKAFLEAQSEEEKAKAKVDYDQALASERDAHDASIKAYEDYQAAEVKRVKAKIAYQEARMDFLRTPEGIEELRAKGKHEQADRYEAERAQSIADFHVDKAVKAAPSDPEALKSARWKIDRDKQWKSTDLRSELGMSTTLPEIQQELMKSRSPQIRFALAHNKNLMPEVQERLSMDNNYQVRRMIATRTSDRRLLNKLAKDDDVNVRIAVASNKNTDPATLRAMSTMPTTGTVRPTKDVFGYSSGPDSIAEAVSKNPSTPASTLSKMYRAPAPLGYGGRPDQRAKDVIVNRIARNPSTPVKVLSQMANDYLGSGKVSGVDLINNPSLPRETAIKMIKHAAKNDSLRNARILAENCAHKDIRSKFMDKMDALIDPETHARKLAYLAQHGSD